MPPSRLEKKPPPPPPIGVGAGGAPPYWGLYCAPPPPIDCMGRPCCGYGPWLRREKPRTMPMTTHTPTRTTTIQKIVIQLKSGPCWASRCGTGATDRILAFNDIMGVWLLQRGGSSRRQPAHVASTRYFVNSYPLLYRPVLPARDGL